MSNLFPNYHRKELDIIFGENQTLVDTTGRKYLDFTSGIGVVALGYSHPMVTQAVQKQADKIWHVPNLYKCSLQEQVACQLIGDNDYLAFFCNSGTEANEAAIKLIKKFSNKPTIITFINSFHGRTYGSMSATGQKKVHEGFGELISGFRHVPYNDIRAFVAALDDSVGGVLLELVQGEGGVLSASPMWIHQIAKICQEKDILLAIDEVQTGIGRTGTLYSFEQYNIQPDIFTIAKSLGNGLPIGAMIGKKELASAFGPGSHGSTFGGNKVALAAASATLEVINSPEFLREVKEKGQFLKEELMKNLNHLKNVIDIRGKGLMIGIQISNSLTEIVDELAHKNLLVLTAGKDVIRLLPPLTISYDELVKGVSIITEVLSSKK